MKYLRILLLSALIPLIVGCSDQANVDLNSNDSEISLRSKTDKKLPHKMKGEVFSDLTSELTTCEGAPFFSKGWIKGNVTHLGKIVTEESPWEIVACAQLSEFEFKFVVDGTVTGPNGDFFYYVGVFISNLASGDVSGEITINDGIGKFAGVEGWMEITKGQILGEFNSPPFAIESTMEAEGYIILK